VANQSQRQEARRAAREVVNQRQRKRAERDKRVQDAAVRVLVALREREQAVTECERRAGEALQAMTDGEGLSLREAADWLAGVVSVAEVTRLRRLPVEAASGLAEEAARGQVHAGAAAE
jgi:hypothetical protein